MKLPFARLWSGLAVALPAALALALLLLVSTAAPACGETTTSTFCTFDSDCPESGTPFCINGVCQADECAEDRDCDDGETCVEGICGGGEE